MSFTGYAVQEIHLCTHTRRCDALSSCSFAAKYGIFVAFFQEIGMFLNESCVFVKIWQDLAVLMIQRFIKSLVSNESVKKSRFLGNV